MRKCHLNLPESKKGEWEDLARTVMHSVFEACMANATIYFDEDFIARVAALVARPRAHLVRYHGLFAPNARERAHIVARPKVGSKPATDDEPQPSTSTTPMRWMARWHRVFAIDLSRCPTWGGERQVMASIAEPGVTGRILEHIGLEGRVPPRAPPQAS